MLNDIGRRYRDRFVLNADGPARPEDLQALEREIGQRLPADYRAFLEAVNGGELHYATRVPADPDGDPVVFYDLPRASPERPGKYGEGTLIGEYRRRDRAWLRGYLGHDAYLPIAMDLVEDTLWLDLSERGYGRVIADVEAHPRWTGVLRDEDFVGAIAGSFEAYLDGLFFDSETAAELWQPLDDSPPDEELREALEEWFDRDLPGWRDACWATPPRWATPAAPAAPTG